MLVEYLAGRFTYHSLAAWEREIAQNRILVNGRHVAPTHALSRGDTVAYTPEAFEEPAANLAITLLYEDPWILAVDKPPCLLVHRAGRAFTRNLVYLVRMGMGVPPAAAAVAVNRLDRETSGVVLMAKDPGQARLWSAALSSEQAVKQYTAVVHGVFPPGWRLIDAPIGKEQPASRESYRHAVRPGGKEARTEVVSAEPIGPGYSLVTVRLLTGRTHQARLHCAFAGCPVVGDRLYGGSLDRVENNGAGLIARHALHCGLLHLIHPHTRQALTIESPLPADMAQLVQRIKRSTSTQVLP